MRLCVFCNKEIHGLNETHERVCKAWQDYEKALVRNEKLYAPLIDANRKAQQITGDDLNIRVGGGENC